MQYDLNQIADPKRFQRLVNAILTARFGEDARLTPIHGADGGSDGETAAANPFLEYRHQAPATPPSNPLIEAPRPGRYLFQAKYHRTGDQRLSDLRSIVVSEFKDALGSQIKERTDFQDLNYFFLVTNVTASKESLKKIDNARKTLLKGKQNLHADVWWGERITAALDWAPDLWHAYPEIFPGGTPPLLGMATTQSPHGISRTLKLAIGQQYTRESKVKFRQIELEKRLLDLFVDLDIGLVLDADESTRISSRRLISRLNRNIVLSDTDEFRSHRISESVLNLLLDDLRSVPKILIEGGPGQGKSTITQMAAQVYREKFLDVRASNQREPAWHRLCQLRIPVRIELRNLAHWISTNKGRSLEQYIAQVLSQDSGGVNVQPDDIHQLLEHSSAILFLDGLDEIGNDALRDQVLDVAFEAIQRMEDGLHTDLRVVLTTRPPAVVGRWNRLTGFVRIVLAPMETKRIDDYVGRWLEAHIQTRDEKRRIKDSFNSRRNDPHVEALARNPMQLSVLLQFIQLKGEAFPDRRAELYRDYFQIVIDRDVEKSPELREHREVVEGLHSYVGFVLHGYAEVEKGRRALNRSEIVQTSGDWLEAEGYGRELAGTYFALGEERFGLIVALSGEGQGTTYGFEVQPIQEYFAASYISNRLPSGTAHDVFEKLIYRDYWREVALFLAGLRRYNEKADLVARAKQADAVASEFGQENGRTIILQLLREGVLSQPRHVQKEAMRYALGFLDNRVLRLHRNPNELIGGLTELARVFESNETRDTIIEHVCYVSDSEDHDFVSLMHSIASRAVPREQYRELILGYEGKDVETRGLVRINRPFRVPGLVEDLGRSGDYWDGIGPAVFARRLWMSATRNNIVPEVVYPNGAHLHLIVQFSVGQSSLRTRREGVLTLQGSSVPAIWRLYRNIQLIRNWPADEIGSESFVERHFSDDVIKRTLWTNGRKEPLPNDVVRCLRDLMDSSERVICELRNASGSSASRCLVLYLQSIKRHLECPGLVGWIAARCAAELLRSGATARNGLKANGLVDDVIDILHELHLFPDMHYLGRLYLVDRFGSGMPLAMRLQSQSEWRPLYEIMSKIVLGKATPEIERYSYFLSEIPLPPAVVRPLIDACRGKMEGVLRFIGARKMASGPWHYRDRRLRVQDTQSVLKICRNTCDKIVLQGAAKVLTNATFGRLAEPEVVRKVISAAPDSSLVMRLFSTRDGMRRQQEDAALKNLGRDVAHRILNEPDLYPFRLVNRAAVFLGEVETKRNIPLFEESPDLPKSPDA